VEKKTGGQRRQEKVGRTEKRRRDRTERGPAGPVGVERAVGGGGGKRGSGWVFGGCGGAGRWCVGCGGARRAASQPGDWLARNAVWIVIGRRVWLPIGIGRSWRGWPSSGQRAGRHVAFWRRQDGGLSQVAGARRPRPAVARAPRVRPAGAVCRDPGGAGVGGDAAARSGAGRSVDDSALGAVRAARRPAQAHERRRRGVGRAAAARGRARSRPRDRQRPTRDAARRPAPVCAAPTWCCFPPIPRYRWRSRSSCP
jgi:hypothetical protein